MILENTVAQITKYVWQMLEWMLKMWATVRKRGSLLKREMGLGSLLKKVVGSGSLLSRETGSDSLLKMGAELVSLLKLVYGSRSMCKRCAGFTWVKKGDYFGRKRHNVRERHLGLMGFCKYRAGESVLSQCKFSSDFLKLLRVIWALRACNKGFGFEQKRGNRF